MLVRSIFRLSKTVYKLQRKYNPLEIMSQVTNQMLLKFSFITNVLYTQGEIEIRMKNLVCLLGKI